MLTRSRLTSATLRERSTTRRSATRRLSQLALDLFTALAVLANCERLFSGTLKPPAALASDTDRITHDTMQMGEDFMEAQECPKVWLQRGAV